MFCTSLYAQQDTRSHQHQFARTAKHMHEQTAACATHRQKQGLGEEPQDGLPEWTLKHHPHSAPPNRGGCCRQPPWPDLLLSDHPMSWPGRSLPLGCMLTAVCKHRLLYIDMQYCKKRNMQYGETLYQLCLQSVGVDFLTVG